MLRFLFFRLWFIFLPVIAYALYVAWARGRARRLGQPLPELFGKHGYWVLVITVLLAIGGFIVTGINEPVGDTTYESGRMR